MKRLLSRKNRTNRASSTASTASTASTSTASSSTSIWEQFESSEKQETKIRVNRRRSHTIQHKIMGICKDGHIISSAVETALKRFHDSEYFASQNTSSKLPGASGAVGQTLSEERYHAKEEYVAPNVKATSCDDVLAADYAPDVFYSLRQLFGVSEYSYQRSLCKDSLLGSDTGAGASGSIFFLSFDNRYIVKSLPKKELDKLRAILLEYHQHMIKYPNSLLPKFLGLYKIKIGKKWRRVVVMNNAFYTPFEVHQKYDLKGSTVSRTVSDEKQAAAAEKGKTAVLKDSNLQTSVLVHDQTRGKFLLQLNEDAQFLCSHSIMDYSLLLGIHTVDSSKAMATHVPTVQPSSVLPPPALSAPPPPKLPGPPEMPPPPSGPPKMPPPPSGPPKMPPPPSGPPKLPPPPPDNAPVSQSIQNKFLPQHMRKSIPQRKRLSVSADMANEAQAAASVVAEELRKAREAAKAQAEREYLEDSRVTTEWQAYKGGFKAFIEAQKNEGKLQPAVIFVAIIDVLQQWNSQKKAENFLKTKIIIPVKKKKADFNADISAQNPLKYFDRFTTMANHVVESLNSEHNIEGDEDWLGPRSLSDSTQRLSINPCFGIDTNVAKSGSDK